jgi:hypothetical protein
LRVPNVRGRGKDGKGFRQETATPNVDKRSEHFLLLSRDAAKRLPKVSLRLYDSLAAMAVAAGRQDVLDKLADFVQGEGLSRMFRLRVSSWLNPTSRRAKKHKSRVTLLR